MIADRWELSRRDLEQYSLESHRRALQAIAQQPDEANTITRTLFVSLAMIESTAIYCFVVAMILLFANPFWNWAIEAATRTMGS